MTFRTRGFVMSVAAASVLATVAGASAQIVNLSDRNSLARFDVGTQAGQDTWLVDGVDHMYQQWFWVRAGGDQFERSLDTLAPLGLQVTDTNFFSDPAPDTLAAAWREPGLARYDVELNVTLRGASGGSGRSDITEQIRITNNTNTVLPYSFFQYVDLDLNNTIPDASVQILNGERAEQVDENGVAVSETVLTPLPSRYEVNFYPNTLGSLNDGGVTVLNNNAGPLGPGDLTWAFEWDFNLAPGQSVLISKDKSIVPTPGATTLLALGGMVLARRRRRS